ncbi:MAG: hypothetical protein HYZ37_07260 [Candidatus Solibacter usitatus]|nr:hypothetical protein [Candidatus Solibacter usitatus]
MTQASEDQLSFVVHQRQVMTICCMALLVIGLVASLAYVCGRSISAMRGSVVQAAPIIIEPPPRVTEAKAVLPPAVIEKPSALGSAAKVAPSAPVPVAGAQVKPSGEMYFQVGLTTRTSGGGFVDRVAKLGLAVHTADTEWPDTVRVLVGPLSTTEEYQQTDKKLTAAGMQHFPRKY